MPSLLAIVNALLAAASATILVSDDFSTNGNLVGSTPDEGGVWAAHSGAGVGALAVSQGAVTVRGESALYAEDANSPISPAVSTGSAYAALDLNYPTPSTTMGTVVAYFTHFIGPTSTNFVCRVYPTGHTSTGYKLAIGVFTETPTATTNETLAYGTTYRLVYSFDTVTDKCSLWVNPTSETSASIQTALTAAATTTINGIAFRQSVATPPWTLSIRNLAVATTFCEAALCGGVQPPPTPRAPPPPPMSPPSPPIPQAPPPPPSFFLNFNGETSSYTGGCQSTYITQDTVETRNTVYAAEEGVWWDGDTELDHQQVALVQFTDIIGNGPNQLRPHEQVLLAKLRYYVDTNYSTTATGDPASLHEVSIPWEASETTWDTFSGPQGLNENEYRVPAVGTAPGRSSNWSLATNPSAWLEVDVTASVNRWLRGSSNNGWIFIPTAGDGAQMRSCDSPPNVRIHLVVAAGIQPPRPPSPPARPPPPPPPPSPPPSPPIAPYTVRMIGNAQHASLRKFYALNNYATNTGVFWDANSAYARGARTSHRVSLSDRPRAGRLLPLSCCALTSSPP